MIVGGFSQHWMSKILKVILRSSEVKSIHIEVLDE